MKILCPNCRSEDVTYRKKKMVYICEDCDHEFTINREFERKQIFISYGHDEHSLFAERLKNDLEQRGHRVWFDLDRLKAGVDWEEYIESGLEMLLQEKKNSLVLLLLTPHSVRRPDGYCLNEISRALSRGIKILPVMVADSEPPLSICKVQWLDMRSCVPLAQNEMHYSKSFERLAEAIELGNLDFEGTQNRFLQTLKPISFSADIIQLLNHFVGRGWIINEIDSWLADPSGDKVFLMLGAPGIGKSSISAWIRDNRREVAAFHFCDIHSEEKRSPAKLVLSLVYQLSTQLYEYQDRLSRLPIDEIIEEYDEAFTLFDLLIVQPLTDAFPKPDRKVVILIDALDEASFNRENEIARLISISAEKTPKWMRFFITSRPEPEVVSFFNKVDRYMLDTSRDENIEDLHAYIKGQIPHINYEQIEGILGFSEGVFLYVKNVCEEINAGRLGLDRPEEFPQSLGDSYKDFFDRQFKADIESYEKEIRNLLYPLIASYEPLTLGFLVQYGGFKNKNELFDRLNKLGSLFPRSGDEEADTIRPFHRSVYDWITDNSMAYLYYIDISYGHQVLCDFGWDLFNKGQLLEDEYFRNYLPKHLVANENWTYLSALVSDFSFFDYMFREGKQHELMILCKQLNIHSDVVNLFQKTADDLKGRDKDGLLICFLRELTQLLRDMGLTEEALPFAKRYVEIYKSNAKEEDEPALANAYRELAETLRLLKDFESAYYYYMAALKTYLKKQGEESVEVATIYHDFAEFHRDQGDYEQAIEYNKKALRIRENLQPLDLPALADCINDTGVLISESSNNEDILPYYEKALELFKQHYGEKHFDIAAVYGNIGNYYLYNSTEAERIQLALKYYIQGYHMAKEFRVLHHPQVSALRRQVILGEEHYGNFENVIPLQKDELQGALINNGRGSFEVLFARLELVRYLEGSDKIDELVGYQMENISDLTDYPGLLTSVAEEEVEELYRRIRNTAFLFIERQYYSEAEAIYTYLWNTGFEMAGTGVHLIRLFLLQGKEAKARYYLDEAEKFRDVAKKYILVRLLFFRLLFSYLNEQDSRLEERKMEEMLNDDDSRLLWTIQLILDRFKDRISASNFMKLEEFLKRMNQN